MAEGIVEARSKKCSNLNAYVSKDIKDSRIYIIFMKQIMPDLVPDKIFMCMTCNRLFVPLSQQKWKTVFLRSSPSFGHC
jgi:hypothetical protein